MIKTSRSKWINATKFSDGFAIAKLVNSNNWFVIDENGMAVIPNVPTIKSDHYAKDGSIAFPGEGVLKRVQIGEFKGGLAIIVAERVPYDVELFGTVEDVYSKKYYGVVTQGGYTVDLGELQRSVFYEDKRNDLQFLSRDGRIEYLRELYKHPRKFLDLIDENNFPSVDEVKSYLDVAQTGLKAELRTAYEEYQRTGDKRTYEKVLEAAECLGGEIKQRFISLSKVAHGEETMGCLPMQRLEQLKKANFNKCDNQHYYNSKYLVDIDELRDGEYTLYGRLELVNIDGKFFVKHKLGQYYFQEGDAIFDYDSWEACVPVKNLPGDGKVEAIGTSLNMNDGYLHVAIARSNWDAESDWRVERPIRSVTGKCQLPKGSEVYTGIITPGGYFIDNGIQNDLEHDYGAFDGGKKGRDLFRAVKADVRARILYNEDFDIDFQTETIYDKDEGYAESYGISSDDDLNAVTDMYFYAFLNELYKSSVVDTYTHEIVRKTISKEFVMKKAEECFKRLDEAYRSTMQKIKGEQGKYIEEFMPTYPPKSVEVVPTMY